jgi:hypothetical protein
MSQDDGMVYSTRQIADSLGLGSAMVRKWALALEKVTGQEIPVKRRDGRQFSRWDFETISAAKGLVDTNKGLSIEAALRMVLGGSEEGHKALASPPQASVNTVDLTEAITAAITKGNEPLLAELRQLRQEIEALRKAELNPLPRAELYGVREIEPDQMPQPEVQQTAPRTFTKMGKSLDRFLSRFRGDNQL